MPMLKSRKKTNEFFNRTIKSLKSMFMFHGGQSQVITDIARPPCHPFSCNGRKIKGEDEACCGIKHQQKIIDEFYSDRWMTNNRDDEIYNDKVIVVSSGNNMNDEQCLKMNKKKHEEVKERSTGCCYKLMNKQYNVVSSCRVISQRMKELEMMEFRDVDHVLDVEEVLHYYSRLRSPVYLDIVDSFFTDMYADLLHKPQGSCLHGSKRRPLTYL